MEDFYYSYKPQKGEIDLDFSELAEGLYPYFDQRYKLKSDLEAAEPYPGWVFWYKASDAILDSNNKVSSCPDISQQLLAATQPDPNRRPLILNNAINNFKSLLFTGGQDLILPTYTVILPFTFFAVIKSTDLYGLFDSAPGNENVFRFHPQSKVELWSGSPELAIQANSNWRLITIEAFLDLNSYRNLKIYQNGILVGSNSSTNGNQVAFTTPRIGSINLNCLFNGEIAEVGLLPFRGEGATHNNNYLLSKYQL